MNIGQTISRIKNGAARGLNGAIKVNPDTVKKLASFGEKFTPHYQRLAIGGTALFLQPMIDLRNKDIDDDTRKLNAGRSIARAIIGTVTGFTIRFGAIEATKHFADNALQKVIQEGSKAKLNMLEKFFFSSDLRRSAITLAQDTAKRAEKITTYGNVLGTSLALCIIFFTNFKIDVPFINSQSPKIRDWLFPKTKKDERIKELDAFWGCK